MTSFVNCRFLIRHVENFVETTSEGELVKWTVDWSEGSDLEELEEIMVCSWLELYNFNGLSFCPTTESDCSLHAESAISAGNIRNSATDCAPATDGFDILHCQTPVGKGDCCADDAHQDATDGGIRIGFWVPKFCCWGRFYVLKFRFWGRKLWQGIVWTLQHKEIISCISMTVT